MELTLAQVAMFCGGELSSNSNENLLLTNTIIDSREAKDNTLFVALVGDKVDGHVFVEPTLNNFKAAALVDKQYKETLKLPNLVYVDDVVSALGQLATNYREKLEIPVIGITGSHGKTTVKEMLKSILIEHFGNDQVLATSGNLNNHLGVPLTLLKIENKHKVAVIEMGMNHGGELDYLSKLVKPTIAIVNNVMLAHIGHFGSIEKVAQAKSEIFHGLKNGGVACINYANPFIELFIQELSPQVRVYKFGSENDELYIKKISANGVTEMMTPLGALKIKLNVLGEHNVINALSAIALALNVGCDLNSIYNGLTNYKGYSHRLERKIAFNGAIIVDDSYNASPDSLKAAILAIRDLPKPHWLILGDLGELGDIAKLEHEKLGEFATKNGIECLLTFGELTKLANQTFVGTKLHFDNRENIVEYCLKYLPKNATLLIKGSKFNQLWLVADGLVVK